MPTNLYTRQQLENKFEVKFKGKMASFTYPGYKTVYGRVDEVAFDHKGELIIQMNNNRYTVSLEMVYECLKLL